MHIIFPTDVFPPGSVGGAAWSGFTLAQSLIGANHRVVVVVPQARRIAHRTPMLPPLLDGVPVVRWHYTPLPIPVLHNYSRHEMVWQLFAAVLTQLGHTTIHSPIGMNGDDSRHRLVIHAQHVQTMPAAVMAARQLRVPVIATVRDHWPWHYFATGLHGNHIPYDTTQRGVRGVAAAITDVIARSAPMIGVASCIALPYMVAHVRRRAEWLARADGIIAVSHYIAERLATIVPAERIVVLPNMVDIGAIDAIIAEPLAPHYAVNEPFLLFVGKLEQNKGASLLVDIMRLYGDVQERQQLPLLVVVGSGALQSTLAREFAALGVRTRFLSWVPHDDVLRLMARCEVLLFPSVWGEPLSRVLLEAQAVGAATIAMPTGGTRDILRDGVNGVIARTPEQCAIALQNLLRSDDWRSILQTHARRVACTQFATTAVLPRVEACYEEAWIRVRSRKERF